METPDEFLAWHQCCRLWLLAPDSPIGSCGKCGRIPKALPKEDVVKVIRDY